MAHRLANASGVYHGPAGMVFMTFGEAKPENPDISPNRRIAPMLWQRIRDVTRYRALYGREFSRGSSNNAEAEFNEQLIGYPKNHNYQVRESKLIPCFRLYERYRALEPLYPRPLKSFLDLGSCKGFYVLNVALTEPDCQRAVGIDVHAPFIEVANKVKDYLKVGKASFYQASLDEVAVDPASFGGPFQAVLMLSCYHYFFWGSEYSALAYHSHDEIMTRLAKLCTGTLLLSGRLEFDRLPSNVQERVKSSVHRQTYNTEEFVKAAKAFFDIRIAGHFGRNALFVMRKKGIQ